MLTYIYFVKCPNCEDEHFDFFDDAKAFALGCLSQKPIITQTEVERNDFGECTDHQDLGQVWSWEDECQDTEGGYTEAEPTKSIFTKDDLKLMADGKDPEFDELDNSVDVFETDNIIEHINDRPAPVESTQKLDGIDNAVVDCEVAKVVTHSEDEKPVICKKPIPEGMTIEQLVEEMEENEDTVECTWCEELFDKSECRKEVDLGWLCSRCEMAIKSRGETLTFRENNYWDFLDEDITAERSIEDLVRDSINHLVNDLGKDSDAEDFADDVILDIERNYDNFVPENPENHRKWASAIASEVSRQLNNLEEDLDWHTYKITFTDKVNPNVEHTTTFKTWQSDVEYAWRMSNANIPHTTIKNIELVEEVEELHDLGNEYDGGYPTEKPELPEIDEVSGSHLKLCPECGKESFDIETGICVDCGFN